MARRRTARDYEDDVTAASRAGLAELMTALGAYRDALVLIGGWAPHLILEAFGEPAAFQEDAFQADAFQTKFVHVGSIDIDLVVDPAIIDTERYATIVEALLDRGWEPVAGSLFQFEKTIPSARSGRTHLIRVDFLSPKPLPGGAAPIATARFSATSGLGQWRVPRSLSPITSGTSWRRKSWAVPLRTCA